MFLSCTMKLLSLCKTILVRTEYLFILQYSPWGRPWKKVYGKLGLSIRCIFMMTVRHRTPTRCARHMSSSPHGTSDEGWSLKTNFSPQVFSNTSQCLIIQCKITSEIWHSEFHLYFQVLQFCKMGKEKLFPKTSILKLMVHKLESYY